MKLIFDIGGNKGEWTKKHIKIYQDAKFVYVEPNKELFDITFSDFDKNKVNSYNYAVSNRLGEVDFWICSNDPSISSISETFMKEGVFTNPKWIHPDTGKPFCTYYNYNKPIKVKTITLDKLIDENGLPDLIKIDAEGSESEVIKSLSKKAGKIVFEWHEGLMNNVFESIEHLSTLGYNKFGTQIWGNSASENDEEIEENLYMPIKEFKEMLTDKIINTPRSMQNKNYPIVQKWGMIWVK